MSRDRDASAGLVMMVFIMGAVAAAGSNRCVWARLFRSVCGRLCLRFGTRPERRTTPSASLSSRDRAGLPRGPDELEIGR